jgi:hypothetical protein
MQLMCVAPSLVPTLTLKTEYYYLIILTIIK